jgi:hypothetical protein
VTTTSSTWLGATAAGTRSTPRGPSVTAAAEPLDSAAGSGPVASARISSGRAPPRDRTRRGTRRTTRRSPRSPGSQPRRPCGGEGRSPLRRPPRVPPGVAPQVGAQGTLRNGRRTSPRARPRRRRTYKRDTPDRETRSCRRLPDARRRSRSRAQGGRRVARRPRARRASSTLLHVAGALRRGLPSVASRTRPSRYTPAPRSPKLPLRVSAMTHAGHGAQRFPFRLDDHLRDGLGQRRRLTVVEPPAIAPVSMKGVRPLLSGRWEKAQDGPLPRR